ncbi:ankyrin repeat domain-containing protein [Adhaeribacter arboris]|uniref:Ankyrin repeat domain-containing protein n=1 Tax=Adhaeribacter arboris TaxID=2072846 RepID=A0A2T2YHK9_9BACT|nr:ankyrin repeat domain-containing protein [Adhaeribacter arboris]PSR54994.1 ankyrin repeat domain-containing protein [Adhaeribacter arboris]
MKTQPVNLLRVATPFLLLIVLFKGVSCNNAPASNPEKATMATSRNIKPPQIDIHTAVLTGNLAALQQHIQAGTDVNEKDPFGGSSPLITATIFDKPAEAKLLLEAGADVNFKNKEGSTALHTAAFFCRPQMVKMLLDKGADKTIKNGYGVTAYESVNSPFTEAKPAYDMLGKALGPMGLKLDYAYLEKTRPQIAALLK